MLEWHDAIIQTYPGQGIKNLDVLHWKDTADIVHTVNVYPASNYRDPLWVTRCKRWIHDVRIDTIEQRTNCLSCMATTPLVANTVPSRPQRKP